MNKSTITNTNVNTERKGSFFLGLIKGTLISLSICLVLILIFAFLLRFINISDNVIKPINQVIKVISILIGCFFALKKNKQMGLITGLGIGILFTIVAFLVFSILDGNFEFSKTLVNDIIFGGVIGAICGIICVSIGRSN